MADGLDPHAAVRVTLQPVIKTFAGNEVAEIYIRRDLVAVLLVTALVALIVHETILAYDTEVIVQYFGSRP